MQRNSPATIALRTDSQDPPASPGGEAGSCSRPVRGSVRRRVLGVAMSWRSQGCLGVLSSGGASLAGGVGPFAVRTTSRAGPGHNGIALLCGVDDGTDKACFGSHVGVSCLVQDALLPRPWFEDQFGGAMGQRFGGLVKFLALSEFLLGETNSARNFGSDRETRGINEKRGRVVCRVPGTVQELWRHADATGHFSVLLQPDGRE